MFIVMLYVEVRHTHIEVEGEVNSSHMCKDLSIISKSEKKYFKILIDALLA